MTTLMASIRRHPLLTYFVLTFGLSWGVVAAVAAANCGQLSQPALQKQMT